MATLVSRALAKGQKILLQNHAGLTFFQLKNRKKEKFLCPICLYQGPFADVRPETGVRRHASCPRCGSLERHRLQYLVFEKIRETRDFSKMTILHFAPEPFFQDYFRRTFKSYASADLHLKNVDYKVDLTNLPFDDCSYDCVFASHVLEHIKNDDQALSEIARILQSNGLAILPVPIIADHTIEYPEANPHEEGHVRAPGSDYYDKYAFYFEKIEKYDSRSFPETFQPFICENRTRWPATMPFRPTMEGSKHCDVIPVCFK